MNERRVERVARAICSSMGIPPDERLIGLRSGDDLGARWQTFLPWAQAAVKALENCLIPEYDSTRDQKREDAFVELD